ncbi:MAG: SDR family NAD(P)-dependent oxidoreductase [Bacteroidales bacterium]|nr:SDR family NAD(P)-dependent oxidoreductase [Bacteroidales bacterium]
MNILVTGATGFIGQRLVKRLVENGHTVHVLYRNEEKLKVFREAAIKAFRGELSDVQSIESAMEGCEQVYHLAACATVWAKNKNDYFDINFTGTLNVLSVAKKCEVKKVVVTSTAGVFGPSCTHELVDENTIRSTSYFNEYERTKDYADKYVMQNFTAHPGVVIVCPTRVYGPGELTNSNAATKMIKMYKGGKWKFLPGNGLSVGNYVFVEDVVDGMVLAMDKGRSGERYILGGENLSFVNFFSEISAQTGKKYHLFRVPVGLLMLVARLMLVIARMLGISPLITPGWTRKYLYNWHITSKKAMDELGYQPLSFAKGLDNTLKWLEKL